jgi:hypothetical protein
MVDCSSAPDQFSLGAPYNFLYRSSLDDFLIKAYSNRCARGIR